MTATFSTTITFENDGSNILKTFSHQVFAQSALSSNNTGANGIQNNGNDQITEEIGQPVPSPLATTNTTILHGKIGSIQFLHDKYSRGAL